MNATNLPPDLESYLAEDETVSKVAVDVKWTSSESSSDLSLSGKGEIYLTNRRVVFKRGGGFLEGKEIVEVSYQHISSIELTQESRLGNILGGVFLLVVAVFGWWALNAFLIPVVEISARATPQYLIGFGCLILGVVGIALFFVTPAKYFKIHVVGRKPILISGELEEIIKTIRENREKVQL